MTELPSGDDAGPALPRALGPVVLAAPRAVLGAALLLAIGINFANVIGRYLFLAPLDWAEEVMVFVTLAAVFIGAIAVTADGRHLRMDILSRLLPRALGRAVEILALLALAACCAVVCLQAVRIVTLLVRTGQKSVVVGLPIAVPYAAFVIGFGGMAVVAVLALALMLRRRRTPAARRRDGAA
jgi:C4-dicarboxylate transporter DctQ subunit